MKQAIGLVLLAAACVGCSAWKTGSQDSLPRLPKTRMSPDSVGIEIATVTLDAGSRHLLDEILRELDEQVLPAQQRKQLAANGLRGGLLGNQLPFPVQFLLEEAADRRQRPTAESMLDLPDQQRFVQCRAGKRVGVGLWSAKESVSVPHYQDETSSTDFLENASCQIAIRCEPDGDGAIVGLTPEIEHGLSRQQYVVSGESVHIESRRKRKTYDDLLMQFKLRPGEMILATCTHATDRLGHYVFRSTQSEKQKLLLIRLAQTRVGISFSDSE